MTAFGPDHKCARKHGHAYKVRVCVIKDIDAASSIAIPFQDIESVWDHVGKPLDHTDLNDSLPGAAGNPTTEMLAMYLHGQLSIRLPGRVKIEVRETDSSGVVID